VIESPTVGAAVTVQQMMMMMMKEEEEKKTIFFPSSCYVMYTLVRLNSTNEHCRSVLQHPWKRSLLTCLQILTLH